MTKGLIRRIDLGTTTSDSDKIPANVDKPSPEKIFIPSKPVKQIKERKPREPKPKFDNSEDHT